MLPSFGPLSTTQGPVDVVVVVGVVLVFSIVAGNGVVEACLEHSTRQSNP